MKNLSKKRKIRFWRSVALLLFIGSIIFSFGRLAKLLELKDSYVQDLAIKARSIQKNLVILKTENDSLKARIDATSKIVTSDSTKELARYYIKKYFGNKATEAEKIVGCESGLNNMAMNINKNGSVDRGIFQINSVHADRFTKMYGIAYEIGAHDFELNVEYAKYLYDNQGWNPWVCSRIVNIASK